MARKSILPILVTAAFFFVWPLRARSQNTTNQVKSAGETAHEVARERRVKMPKGTIQQIDLLRRQIKLMTEDGVRTFTYSSRTYVFRDKEKIAPDELKVGEIVALQCNADKDGNLVVLRIKARTPSELMEPPAVDSADVTNSPVATQP